MELSITQQVIKGGSEVLMVRLSKRPLLSFPLHMRKLADSMVNEALSIDEKDSADLIALVQKYGKLKADFGGSEADAPPPARTTVTMPVNGKPLGGVVIYPASLSPEPQSATAEIGVLKTTTWMERLAELLDCARQAEFQMDAAATDLERATNTFAEAERRANLAWQAFNEALHASLPTGTRIRGIQSDE